MINKYFSVTKKMPIIASLQHTAAFGSGDVLVDWQPIQIPKGSSCLRSLTMLVRPKGDATPTDNDFAAQIIFSTTNTQSLGTVNGAVLHRPFPDTIGLVEIESGMYCINVFNSTVVAQTSGGNGDTESASPPLILTGDPLTGDNVGFDTIYVGIVANGAFDFRSINAVNETGFSAGAQTAITMDGSGMDVREHFAAGDVLHAQDDAVLGTVASVGDATTGPINLTAANTDAIAEDDIIYNLHPITLVLGLEK
tara:strand:- start:82 stop:837 length:756 start_codon:yes stop_codon:yes gene_type:complete